MAPIIGDPIIAASIVFCDDEMSTTSENPVQNKVVTASVNDVKDNLFTVAGAEPSSDTNKLWLQTGGDIVELAEMSDLEEIKNMVGAPMVVDTVAEMNDIERVYVYTGSETGYTSGNWYYYDGTAWVSGGVYNAVAVETDDTLTQQGEAADAKAVGDALTQVSNALSELSGEVDAMYKVSSNIFDPDTETKVIAINSSGKCLFFVDESSAYRGVIFGFESTKNIGYKFTYSGSGISSVKLASYAQKPTSNSDDFVALRKITGTRYNDDYVGLLLHDTGAAYYVFDVEFSSGAAYDTIFNAIRSNLYIFESDATALQDIDWDSINYVPHMILNVSIEALPEELADEIDNKVDKIQGKELSQNDFTDTDVEKLNDCYEELFGESEIVIKYGDEGITSGSWASTTDGTIKTTDNTRIYDVTDYIPCTYGDKLYLCEVQSICFYDSAKSFLSGGGITISNIAGYTGNGLQNDYTVSLQNAAYMRVNFYNSNYSSQMVGGRYAVCKRNDNPHIILNLGDSLFGLNPKPYDISTHVQDITGVKTANCGFGGTRAATHSISNYNLFSLYNLADAIYSEDFSAQDAADFSILGSGYYYKYNLRTLESIDFDDVRLITLAYGTNDWNANIPIDNTDDPDDYTTFKGALRYSISKIQSKYPDIMIVLLSPIYRTFDSHTVDSNTKTNSAGKTLIDYVDAVKEVAAEYELPFVDNYRNSGINIYNSTVFLRDETHLTFDNGANRIGTITGRELSKFLSR